MTLAELKDQVLNCLLHYVNRIIDVTESLDLVLGMLVEMSEDELSESLGLREMHPVSHASPPHRSTTSPPHRLTASPPHHLTTSPPHRSTTHRSTNPPHHLTTISSPLFHRT